MGACSSKASAAVRLTPEARERRMIRKRSSARDLQRAVDDYHACGPRLISPKLERFRPAPIAIAQPHSVDERKPAPVLPVAITLAKDVPVVDSPYYSQPTSSTASSSGRD